MYSLKIIVFVLTVIFITVVDLKKHKKPFDDKGKLFDWKKDWFVARWDDALSWMIGGAIGCLLASEIANPLIEKYTDFPELTEGSIELTSIAFCTLIGAKLLEKLFGAI